MGRHHKLKINLVNVSIFHPIHPYQTSPKLCLLQIQMEGKQKEEEDSESEQTKEVE